MATYDRCSADDLAYFQTVMDKHHGPLRDAGVTLSALWAIPPEKEDGSQAPAIVVHGYAAIAMIKITSAKERALGLGDVLLVIDYEKWTEMNEQQQEAVIDHEFTHVDLVRDPKTGRLRRDDSGRPKLAMRKHDWHMGGFNEVVKRHGESAVESVFVKKLVNDMRQLQFDFTAWG